ncbi:MAG: acetate--CoA ligase family protein [Deltaproteobacteria bacterium]|nr:acetate--CoA ligase family protein [Deltaproteobacteria bacterium]
MGYVEVIKKVRDEGRKTLSEYESKQVLKEFGIPIIEEYYIEKFEQIYQISKLKYPIVAKGVARTITHKTEKNLVRLWIKDEDELKKEFSDLISTEGVEGVLLSTQITDMREFLLGLKYDKQFGYTIIFGLGGIFTEVLKDISIRICPITEGDAKEMMSEIRSSRLLGSIRGYPPVNIKMLSDMMINLSKLSETIDDISEVDINPVMFEKGNPVAVDALVVLKD